MKKIIQSASSFLLLSAMACGLMAGCNRKASRVQYEVSSYQGQLTEGQLKSDYNKALFYRNDHKIHTAADPFVLDNTAVDGWYYLYGTYGSIITYRSLDLMEWEPVGNALDNLDYGTSGAITEERRATWADIWAPEVIYDYDEKLYYMFFCATPDTESFKTANGVYEGTAKEVLMVAVSQYPDHGFKLINFRDPKSCGAENLHTFNAVPGTKDENGNVLDAYPHYYAKYLFFDPAEYKAFTQTIGGFRGEYQGGYEQGIDPHPYVDDDGTKYMFWVDSTGSDRLCVVKMDTWLKPDWTTAKALLYHSFYTVEDWEKAQNGEAVEFVSYELESVSINEGPQVIKHNGKYYLTYSMGAYADSSYQVGQAVADHITGPYRKLTEAEGGVLMSGNTSGSQEISGTGHHGFVTVGDQLFMVYHRHNDIILAGGARNPAVDEIKWITIKDKDGNDLDVMYSNGPTCTVQPKVERYAEYVNIADEAKVSGSSDAKYLTDGLLSIYKYANPDFLQYVQETTITKKTTFTFDFAEARPVRAVMVYNSKLESTAFTDVARVEFVCEEDGKEVVRFIKDIRFGSENFQANDYDGSIYYITPGAAAYAEFDQLNVKSVRVTVDVPEGQEAVGISEIRILGK